MMDTLSKHDTDLSSKTKTVYRFVNRQVLIAQVVICAFVLYCSRYIIVSYDDAYITYVSAVHLAQGYGMNYNVDGVHYLSTSAPLFCAAIGTIAWIVGSPHTAVPIIGGILSLLALAATGLGLVRIGAIYNNLLGGFIAGVIYIGMPPVHYMFGCELLVVIALAVWVFVSTCQRQMNTAAILSALAIMVRPESALIPLLSAGWYLFRERRLPVKPVAVFAVMLAAFFAAIFSYYHSFLPGTATVKMIGGQHGAGNPPFAIFTRNFFSGFFHSFDGRHGIGGSAGTFPLVGEILALAAVGVCVAVKHRWVWPVIAWVAAYTGLYICTGMPGHPWYMLPLCFGIAVLAALPITEIAKFSRAGKVLAVALLVCYAVSDYPKVMGYYSNGHGPLQIREHRYVEVGKWINAHTPKSAAIGVQELGWLGYYSDRRMVEPCGLINKADASYFISTAESGSVPDWTWPYQSHKPDYIVIDDHYFPDAVSALSAAPWFSDHYRKVATLIFGEWEPDEVWQRYR